MSHDQVPESWVRTAMQTVIGVIVTAAVSVIGWIGARFLGRIAAHDLRLQTLERIAAVNDERHHANLQRLDSIDERSDRIEQRTERIEDKLDRLMER